MKERISIGVSEIYFRYIKDMKSTPISEFEAMMVHIPYYVEYLLQA